MSKIFSILAFMVLCVGFTFGQAFVDIPITISDNGSGSWICRFGLDLTATDGIDPALGESDLPPFPPPGAFEVRFWLPPFNAGALTSYQDYRNAPAFPFSGSKEHRVKWQYSDFATALTFTYDLPDSVQITITSNNAVPVWTSGPRTGSGSFVLDDPDNGYSAARIQVVYMSIIPVELVSFGASINENSVNLNWQTATELNNSGFEVQKKTENTDWQNIGFVSGAGTSSELHNYSFSDGITDLGVIKYRIKQIDFDGTFSYSKEVEVDLGSITKFNLNQNYPNPFNPSTTISFSLPGSSNVTLTIFNQIGEKVDELVNKNLEAGFYTYNWDASKYSSGNYFYELKTNESKSVRKMTLIK